jgi:D-inositol-3-phosphate glycosyltransferase
MRIAMVSEHASPLAVLGGVDAGGQNVHVAALSVALARLGNDVTVYTRRDSVDLPDRVTLAPGVEVVHITAGPPVAVPKDQLLPYMTELADGLVEEWTDRAPDVVHSHFWMSGVAAIEATTRLAAEGTGALIPVVHTFHALGAVKRRHQGVEDTSPSEREWLEPWVGRTAASSPPAPTRPSSCARSGCRAIASRSCRAVSTPSCSPRTARPRAAGSARTAS